jgi:uncharacterized membrane protein
MKRNNSKYVDFIKWFQNYYIHIFIIILFLFLLIAFLAPLMMHLGYDRLGNAIYSVYSSLCHQFAHRSWFLFGQQSHYPIVKGNFLSERTLTEVFGNNTTEMNISRKIIGNQEAGYKVAICQRDVMIYFSLLVFSILFYFFKNKIKKIPFMYWIIFAIMPIAIDGIWQLLTTIKLFNFPNHESTPLIRSITGGLFGFFSGWYILPAMMDTFDNVNNESC